MNAPAALFANAKIGFKDAIIAACLKNDQGVLDSCLKPKELQKKYFLAGELDLFYNVLGIIKLRKASY